MCYYLNSITFLDLMKTFLSLVFCAIFLLSTRGQTEIEYTVPDSNLVFKANNFEGVVFGKNFKERITIDSSRTLELDPLIAISEDDSSVRYVPTIDEVVIIENQLKSIICKHDSFISDSLHRYVKQYFGYITSSHDTIIYINCFFDEEMRLNGKWNEFFIRVFDGWHFYFSVKYNVSRNEFFDLQINGWG